MMEITESSKCCILLTNCIGNIDPVEGDARRRRQAREMHSSDASGGISKSKSPHTQPFGSDAESFRLIVWVVANFGMRGR